MCSAGPFIARRWTGWGAGRRSDACTKTPLEELLELVLRLPFDTSVWISVLLCHLDDECVCLTLSSVETTGSELSWPLRSRRLLFLAIAEGSLNERVSLLLDKQEDKTCECDLARDACRPVRAHTHLLAYHPACSLHPLPSPSSPLFIVPAPTIHRKAVALKDLMELALRYSARRGSWICVFLSNLDVECAPVRCRPSDRPTQQS